MTFGGTEAATVDIFMKSKSSSVVEAEQHHRRKRLRSKHAQNKTKRLHDSESAFFSDPRAAQLSMKNSIMGGNALKQNEETARL